MSQISFLKNITVNTSPQMFLRFLLILFLLNSFSYKGVYAQEQPNVILILADDLGWGDVGFNGNTEILTPNLDRMASTGVILNRFYSASPVCSPTRASCLTGRNPYRQGIYTANVGHLKEEEITIAELLKEQGYTTGIFGKWHLGTLTTKEKDANRGSIGENKDYATPDRHGFDHYFVTESKVPTYDPLIKPEKFDTKKGESLRYGWSAVKKNQNITSYGTSYWTGKDQKPAPEQLKGDDTKIIMDQSLKFMKKAVANNQPYLSVIWLHTPHLPVVTDKVHRDLYPNASHEEKLYWGSITAMDKQIGRLQKFLKDEDISENTIIFFASDNGPELRTPGTSASYRGKKRDLYEGGVRVPAFCVWPSKIEPGKMSDLPSITSDYLPTIMTMINGSFNSEFRLDGISIFEQLQRNYTERKQGIGFQYPNRISWVTDDYKIVRQHKNEPFEMYHLKKDPFEKTNIIDKNPKLFYQLSNDLFSWIESCKKSELGQDYKN